MNDIFFRLKMKRRLTKIKMLSYLALCFPAGIISVLVAAACLFLIGLSSTVCSASFTIGWFYIVVGYCAISLLDRLEKIGHKDFFRFLKIEKISIFRYYTDNGISLCIKTNNKKINASFTNIEIIDFVDSCIRDSLLTFQTPITSNVGHTITFYNATDIVETIL